MIKEQYSVINNTKDITLYLNSKEISMKPGEMRWFYFDTFDVRYILSDVGFLIIGHKFGKIFIENGGQLEYTIDQEAGVVYVKSKEIKCNCAGAGQSENCKTCKWYNKKVPNMAYCAKPTDDILNGDIPNPKEYKCDKYEGE